MRAKGGKERRSVGWMSQGCLGSSGAAQGREATQCGGGKWGSGLVWSVGLSVRRLAGDERGGEGKGKRREG